MTYLDFEQPIEALNEQLSKLLEIGKKNAVDVSDSIKELEEKIINKRREIYSDLTPWQKVQVARHPNRPYTLHYIEQVFEKFEELFGDRKFGDDKAIVGGLAQLEGKSYMVIGHQKGINTKMRQFRNFGMANPEGYRKAIRLMTMAEKFDIPIITFIDTPGAYPGIEAEERGQSEAIANNLYKMLLLKTPILSYVIGEGASGGAIGIGVADRAFMLEYTWYSVISPESCSSILWRDWDHKAEAANSLKLTSEDIKNFGIIDGIVREPIGGAHVNHQEIVEILKDHILEQIKGLKKLKNEDFVKARISKYEKIGSFEIQD